MEGMCMSLRLEDYVLHEFPDSISVSLGEETREYRQTRTARRTIYTEDGLIGRCTCDACGWTVHRQDSFCCRCGAMFID